MSVRVAEMFETVRRRPAEYAWTHTCRAYDAAEQSGEPLAYDQLRHLTITALDRCRYLGRLSASQISVLVKHGVSGPPSANSAVRLVWDRALHTLESEMNRMVFPSSPPAGAPHYFYGSNGTPFVDAANAWWWALDCLDARHDGVRGDGPIREGRPCEPDDIVNALRRLDLSPLHARTVIAWGKRRTEPPEGTEPRRFWDEAMARLTEVLRAKGIVRGPKPTDAEIMDLPLTAVRSIPIGRFPREADAQSKLAGR